MNTKVQAEIACDMLRAMPKNRASALFKACDRNMILTSWWGLEHGYFEVYIEGFYLRLEGCRSGFNVWAWDNDGELVVGRKPRSDKLHYLYTCSLGTYEFMNTVNELDRRYNG